MLTELMRDWSIAVIHAGGIYGAAALMALGSMVAPVPNELVMPPLGMEVHAGRMTWEAAMIATSIGSLVGSLISYYIGYFGGKPLVMKVGKYLLVNEEHLDMTTRWFKRWGSLTVFVSRFLPIVRHFISIPAGTAKMNIVKFSLYTLIGATIYNAFLLWVGWKLEDHWDVILQYRKPIDALVAVGLVVLVVAWFYLHLRKPKAVAISEAVAEAERPG